MGAVLVIAGGFLHFKLRGVSSVAILGGMGEVVFSSYGKPIISGRGSFLGVSCGGLTPPGNTSGITWYLGTETHRFLYFQVIHNHSYAILVTSKGL